MSMPCLGLLTRMILISLTQNILHSSEIFNGMRKTVDQIENRYGKYVAKKQLKNLWKIKRVLKNNKG